jgi:hypothetical protein
MTTFPSSSSLHCECGGVRVVQGDDAHKAWLCLRCGSEIAIGSRAPIFTKEQLAFFDPSKTARAT